MTFNEAQIAAKRLAGDDATICLAVNVWLGRQAHTWYSINAFYGQNVCEGGYGASWDTAMEELTRKWNARPITGTVESVDVAAMEAARVTV
jgi:hypothetical protein